MTDPQMIDSLPALRFDGGNVIIKLNADPNSWLIVHAEIFDRHMPALSPGFKPQWGRSTKVFHPGKEVDVDVYTLGLKYVDHTYLLEGKDFVPCSSQQPSQSELFPCPVLVEEPWPQLFQRSVLVEEPWPEVFFENYPSSLLQLQASPQTAELAHRILFAVLYGYDIPTEAFLSGGRYSVVRGGRRTESFPEPMVNIVIEVCAYAEYYGCHDVVAPRLFKQLVECDMGDGFWADVANRPVQYLRLATRLRDKKLYFEAARDLIGHWGSSEFWRPCSERVAQAFGMTTQEFEAMAKPAVQERDERLKCLEQELLRLQLQPQAYTFSLERFVARNNFLNWLSFKNKTRSDYAKARERYDNLARTFYGQWLVQQLYGSYVYDSGRGPREASPPSFNILCQRIVRAAKSDDPSAVLGFKVASRLRSIFKLQWDGFKADQRLKKSLDELVKEAAEKIEDALGFDETSTKTRRRCEYDEAEGYSTYLGLFEGDVPWKDEDEGGSQMASEDVQGLVEAAWQTKGEAIQAVNVPVVDMTPASQDWVGALGLKKDKSALST